MLLINMLNNRPMTIMPTESSLFNLDFHVSFDLRDALWVLLFFTEGSFTVRTLIP